MYLFIYLLWISKELKIDIKNRSQQSHIWSRIPPNILIPDINNEDRAYRQWEQRRLSLESELVLPRITIRALHIHHQETPNLVPRCQRRYTQPDALRGALTADIGVENLEFHAEKNVQKSTFAAALSAENGNDAVVETSVDKFGVAVDKVGDGLTIVLRYGFIAIKNKK